MRGDRIQAKVLSVRVIANADPMILKCLKIPKSCRSIGIITTDSDDVSYVALDEATKKADVEVVYAKSLYAGAKNASTSLAGEFIGILAGKTPEDVKSGLDAAVHFVENEGSFYSANTDDSIIYFSHCISRTGSYLSKMAKVPEGTAIAYLIAPPLEAVYSLEKAIKSTDVEMKLFYGPPTETNFGGGLLSGDQAACKAACDVFANEVMEIAQNPKDY